MKAIDLKYSFFLHFLSAFFFFFFDGWGRGDVHWRPVWCGVDGSPHRLSSSVLAGRDNYTAVWNKVCTQADGSYATKCIKPSGRHAKFPKGLGTMTNLYPAGRQRQNHYNYLMRVFIWMNAWAVNKRRKLSAFNAETNSSDSPEFQSLMELH